MSNYRMTGKRSQEVCPGRNYLYLCKIVGGRFRKGVEKLDGNETSKVF